jgi:hypothetical protein
MTDKIAEAVRWISRHHSGPPLDRADISEILERADARHKRMYGDPIFPGDIDLEGLSWSCDEDDGPVYCWGLSANEKRLLSRSYSMLMS